ncbi:MAG: BatA domain-containing protein [Candidatus Neomarinimicrobiota bacterium]|nr:BatA domain-containing protein [Candidatus Neomarinimicrobiota bacterium]
MTFLSPLFLWLLPLIAVPTIIHLWNKNRVKEYEFSTISFFKAMEAKAIRKIKIIEIFLLLLRTFITLLIILYISRPLIRGQFSDWITSPESSLTAILIDDSFSMKGKRFDENVNQILKNKVNQIKSGLIDKQYVVFGTYKDGINFFGLKEEFENFEPSFEISDYILSADNTIYQLLDTINTDIVNKELFLLTDLQENTLNANYKLNDWKTYIIDFDIPIQNLVVQSLEILSETIVPNEPFKIKVKIANNGKMPQFQRLVTLSINGLDVGQETLSLDVNQNDIIYFETALPNSGNFKISVNLDQDDILSDNKYIKSVNIAEKINIGFFNDFAGDIFYIEQIISAIDQDKNIINLKNFSRDKLGNINLMQFDILFVSGIIDENLLEKIKNFCFEGKRTMIFPSSKDGKFFDKNLKEIYPITLTNDDYILAHESLIGDASNESLKKILVNKNNQPKFFKYYSLSETENNLIKLENGKIICNRMYFGEGYIDKFGIGFTTEWSNIPLISGFIPFLHNWIYNNLDGSYSSNYLVGDKLKNKKIKPGKKIEIISPDNKKYLIPLIDNGSLSTYEFNQFGWYSLEIDGNIIAMYDVNIPENEKINKKMDPKRIDEFITNKKIFSLKDQFNETIMNEKAGKEIGNYILLLVIFLLILEMFLAHFKLNQGKNN